MLGVGERDAHVTGPPVQVRRSGVACKDMYARKHKISTKHPWSAGVPQYNVHFLFTHMI